MGGDDQRHDELSSATTPESGSKSRAESPGVCETPPEQHRGWAYTQPAVPQLVEPGTRFKANEAPERSFVFDFDIDSGVWVPTDPYLQLGNAFPKDPLDWFTNSFPEPLA